MSILKKCTYIATSLMLISMTSCLEEISFFEESFEDALVLDAVITNEDKHQQVFLSRTYPFEDNGQNAPDTDMHAETNAMVSVLSNSVSYSFTEVGPGNYVSDVAFSAQPNVDYVLQITLGNGKVYTSSVVQLTAETQIDEVYAVRETNDDNVNGMSIYVDSYDPTGASQFYRYEYEETFKIIAPDWVDQDAIVISGDPFCLVGLVPRPKDQITCFRTEENIGVNLFSTANLTEDRVSRHLARFLTSEDYKISHRYSILVKQFVQSEEAFNYLETVSNFSNEGSLFSQIQPGFVAGNMVSESNTDEKVIGFFEVSSVSSKRLYFNYVDFYPNESLPPYINECQIFAPERFTEHYLKTEECGPLIRIIENRIMVFLDTTGGYLSPFLMVPRMCGDCTALGPNVAPDFWVE